MKGKYICQRLKEIRLGIAQANEIDYTPAQCTHKGDCAGTCPQCENELRYIERQLLRRQAIGKAAVVAGLVLGATSIAPTFAQAQAQEIVNERKITEPKLVDCAPSDTTAIIVRGCIIDENHDPLIGASLIVFDEKGKITNKGTVSNIDGLFAIRVSKGCKVRIDFIGYETLIYTLNEPEEDLLIMMKNDKNALMGDVMYFPPRMPDVDADIYEERH